MIKKKFVKIGRKSTSQSLTKPYTITECVEIFQIKFECRFIYLNCPEFVSAYQDTTRENDNTQRYTSNIQMQLKRKNNNNSYPTNQIHLKMLIFQVGKYAHIDTTTTTTRGKTHIQMKWNEKYRDGKKTRTKKNTKRRREEKKRDQQQQYVNRIEYNIIYIIAVTRRWLSTNV